MQDLSLYFGGKFTEACQARTLSRKSTTGEELAGPWRQSRRGQGGGRGTAAFPGLVAAEAGRAVEMLNKFADLPP